MSTQAVPTQTPGSEKPNNPVPAQQIPDETLPDPLAPIPDSSTTTTARTTKRPRVDIQDPDYEVYGVDAIWHNMYAYPTPSDYHPTPPLYARRDTPEPVPREGGGPGYLERPFKGFRGWYDSDANGMVKMVAKHVELGYYDVISMNVSKHSCTVVCGSTKGWEDFKEGFGPYDEKEQEMKKEQEG